MNLLSYRSPKILDGKDKEFAIIVFVVLAGMFIASLISCNLIFRKFFIWDLGGFTFEQSVGLLPYPLTFLVTDVISEIYGKKKANLVVISGLFASFFVLLIVSFAGAVEATVWSPVSDVDFDHVFGQTAVAVGASMAAYLLAQFIDVRIFHFWKHVTDGKHLWLRNNLSTIPSQVVDTSAVLVLLCAVGELGWDRFGTLLVNGVLFKSLVAAADTPLIYVCAGWMRRRFGLLEGQEIEF